MNDVAIRVENLGKRYRIGSRQEAYGTLRDTIVSTVQSSLRTLRGHGNGNRTDEFWALRGVSFEVKQGEVLGIIGPNGAGKSTLLKILSRVTRPTAGRAVVHGRVGSLLEVGTGFHPELSGRENIYLNGAILGMKKSEIQRQFDEIVAFAELERFLDTPVKRYSSGMYMRLAFSIAAHLEPEILIVDEVLAVGDVTFQKKCLGKMQDVSNNQGRTVLFVSHDMNAIQRLCSKCTMLERGLLIDHNDTPSIVARYLSRNSYKTSPQNWIDLSDMERIGTGEVQFVAVQYSSLSQISGFRPYSNGPLEFLLAIKSDAPRSIGSLAVTLSNHLGIRLINADIILLGQVITLRSGHNFVRLRINKLNLQPGVYRLGFWLADPISVHSTDNPYDYVESAFEIEVVHHEFEGNRLRPNSLVTCDFELVEVT